MRDSDSFLPKTLLFLLVMAVLTVTIFQLKAAMYENLGAVAAGEGWYGLLGTVLSPVINGLPPDAYAELHERPISFWLNELQAFPGPQAGTMNVILVALITTYGFLCLVLGIPFWLLMEFLKAMTPRAYEHPPSPFAPQKKASLTGDTVTRDADSGGNTDTWAGPAANYASDRGDGKAGTASDNGTGNHGTASDSGGADGLGSGNR